MAEKDKAFNEEGWRLITPEKLHDYLEKKRAPSLEVKVSRLLLPDLIQVLAQRACVCEQASCQMLTQHRCEEAAAEGKMWRRLIEKLRLQERKMNGEDKEEKDQFSF